jgi:hypothetical protein
MSIQQPAFSKKQGSRGQGFQGSSEESKVQNSVISWQFTVNSQITNVNYQSTNEKFVFNFEHLSFGFISNFDIRISDLLFVQLL